MAIIFSNAVGIVSDSADNLQVKGLGSVTAVHSTKNVQLGNGILYNGLYSIQILTETNPTPVKLTFSLAGYNDKTVSYSAVPARTRKLNVLLSLSF
jgi:hypothetical protein